MALHDGVVPLVHLAVAERPLEDAVRPLALRDDHQPAGADVEAVHDALPLGGAAGRDAVTDSGHTADHGRAGPARARVRGDADRLVDHHDVVVAVHDPQARYRLRHDVDRRGRGGQRDLQPGAGGDLVGLGPGDAVDGDVTGVDEGGGAVRDSPNSRAIAWSSRMPSSPSGTGRARGSCRASLRRRGIAPRLSWLRSLRSLIRSVAALGVADLRAGCCARLSRLSWALAGRAFAASGTRVPSRWRPVNSSRIISTTPKVSAESAPLNTGKCRPTVVEDADHVDHVTHERAGRPEQPVAEVADHPAEHQPERDRPRRRPDVADREHEQPRRPARRSGTPR